MSATRITCPAFADEEDRSLAGACDLLGPLSLLSSSDESFCSCPPRWFYLSPRPSLSWPSSPLLPPIPPGMLLCGPARTRPIPSSPARLLHAVCVNRQVHSLVDRPAVCMCPLWQFLTSFGCRTTTASSSVYRSYPSWPTPARWVEHSAASHETHLCCRLSRIPARSSLHHNLQFQLLTSHQLHKCHHLRMFRALPIDLPCVSFSYCTPFHLSYIVWLLAQCIDWLVLFCMRVKRWSDYFQLPEHGSGCRAQHVRLGRCHQRYKQGLCLRSCPRHRIRVVDLRHRHDGPYLDLDPDPDLDVFRIGGIDLQRCQHKFRPAARSGAGGRPSPAGQCAVVIIQHAVFIA